MPNNKYTRDAESAWEADTEEHEQDEEQVEEQEEEQEEEQAEAEEASPKRKAKRNKPALASEDEEEAEAPAEDAEGDAEEGDAEGDAEEEEERPARTAESVKESRTPSGATLNYIDDSAEGPKGSGEEEDEEGEDGADDVYGFIAPEDDDAGDAEKEHALRRKLDAKKEAEEDDAKVQLFGALSRRNEQVAGSFPRPTSHKSLGSGKLTREQELIMAKTKAIENEARAQKGLPQDGDAVDPFTVPASGKASSKAARGKRKADSGDEAEGDDEEEETDEEDEEETKTSKSPARKPRARSSDTRKVQKEQYVPKSEDRAQPADIVKELSKATGKPQVFFRGHHWDLVDMGAKPNPDTYNLRAAPVSIDHPELFNMAKHDWRRYYAVVRLNVERAVTSKKKKKPDEGQPSAPPATRTCTIFRTFWVAPCGALQWIKEKPVKGAEPDQSVCERLERAICARTPNVTYEKWMALVMSQSNRGTSGLPVVPEQHFVECLEPRSALRRDNAIPVAPKANKPRIELVDQESLDEMKQQLGMFGAATNAAESEDEAVPSNGVHKPVVKRKAEADTEETKPAPKPTPAAAVATARAAAVTQAKPLETMAKSKPAAVSSPAAKKPKVAEVKTPVAKVQKAVQDAARKRQAVLETATEQVSPQARREAREARDADDLAAKRREDVAVRKREHTLESEVVGAREASKKTKPQAAEPEPDIQGLTALQRMQLLRHKAASPAASEKKAIAAALDESKRLAAEEAKLREENERKEAERAVALAEELARKDELARREAKAADDAREKKLLAAKQETDRRAAEERKAREERDAEAKAAKQKAVDEAKARASAAVSKSQEEEKKETKAAAKPVEKETKPTAKPTAKPVEKETKPAVKPVEKETKPAVKPAEKETKTAVKPAEKETKPVVKPAEKGARPAEKEVAKPAEEKAKPLPADVPVVDLSTEPPACRDPKCVVTSYKTLMFYMERIVNTLGVHSVAALYERAPHLVEMFNLSEEEKARLIPRLNGKPAAPM